MTNSEDNNQTGELYIDYDLHGRVGVRLANPAERDADAVAKQLGPLRKILTCEPDIPVRFVDRLPMPDLRFTGPHSGFTEDGFSRA